MKIRALTLALTGALPATLSQSLPQAPLLPATEPKQVAIIGAGAAGASTAYHLSKYAASASVPVNITIFDRNAYIGGRSTTVFPYDDPTQPVLELGASIFVSVNHILVNASRDFGLETSSFGARRTIKGDDAPELGVWDGERMVLIHSSTYWDLAKLVWRYGLAPFRTLSLMKATVGKFLAMYEAPVFPFEDLTAAAGEVELLETLGVTGEELLLSNGISGRFGHDVVQASTRVNYATNLGIIHGLEAMVCMATEGAVSVEGGNWRIFEAMVDASSATRALATEVTSVSRAENGRLVVRAGPGEAYNQEYDEIVLAGPFGQMGIDWETPLDSVPGEVEYVRLHVTLFTSPLRLDSRAFRMEPEQAVPFAVLTTTGEAREPDFLSISLLREVINPVTGALEFAYKIFTLTEVDDAFLRNIFGLQADQGITNEVVSWSHKKLWLSYPVEYPKTVFESTKLAEDVWYTGGMESFISTMETNSLMGMNVARLMLDKWIG